jgi:Uma2 family endonuclease
MEWSQVLADPSLHDLPYKIETNEYGQIVMSPAKIEHCDFQGDIYSLLKEHLPQGKPVCECPVQTSKGVKVPDVAWRSWQFFGKHRGENPYSAAPEICVEVLSESNTRAEIQMKQLLYFESGAVEVWTCDLKGKMTFFVAGVQASTSQLAPNFPAVVDAD